MQLLVDATGRKPIPIGKEEATFTSVPSVLLDGQVLIVGLNRLGLRNRGNSILSLIYRISIGILGGIMLCDVAKSDGLYDVHMLET